MNAVPEKPVDEKLCTNCGKCCYKKIIVGRTVFITPFPCEYLDTSTNLCTIYDKRHELNPLCLSVAEGMKVSAFPEDCPYVPEHAPKGYKPAIDGWKWAEEWHDFDDLADDLDVSPQTREKIRARGPYSQPMYVETYARIQQERERSSSAEQALVWGSGADRVVDARRAETGQDVPSLAQLARNVNSSKR